MECGPAEGLSMRFYMWEGKNDCIFRDKLIWYREYTVNAAAVLENHGRLEKGE